jgi:hypothetical protein
VQGECCHITGSHRRRPFVGAGSVIGRAAAAVFIIDPVPVHVFRVRRPGKGYITLARPGGKGKDRLGDGDNDRFLARCALVIGNLQGNIIAAGGWKTCALPCCRNAVEPSPNIHSYLVMSPVEEVPSNETGRGASPWRVLRSQRLEGGSLRHRPDGCCQDASRQQDHLYVLFHTHVCQTGNSCPLRHQIDACRSMPGFMSTVFITDHDGVNACTSFFLTAKFLLCGEQGLILIFSRHRMTAFTVPKIVL